MATEHQTIGSILPQAGDCAAPGQQIVREWSLLTRIAFGICCGYFLFVWVPWALVALGGFQWPFSKLVAVGQWPITHLLSLPEHSPPSLIAADYLPNYLAALIVAFVSAAVSVSWALVDRRRRSYPRTFAWLYTAVRFMLAAFLLLYGWHKFLPGQYGRFAFGAGTDYLIHQVGQLPPRDLLWAFMEASRPYQVFTGAVELAAGSLLLTRRTTTLGALLSVAAMTNVVMLDVGYDVSVKFLAGQILLMAVFVLAPDAERLLRAVVLTEGERRPLFARPAADYGARVVGALAAAALVVWAFSSAQSRVAVNQAIAQSPLHGIWDVEEISRNGVKLPLVVTNETLWRRLVFPWEGATAGAIVVWMSDAVSRCSSKIDLEAKRIEFEPLPGPSTIAGSVFGLPGASSRQRQSFTFNTPNDHQLILSQTTANGDALVVHLRRFDPETFQLLSHESKWRW